MVARPFPARPPVSGEGPADAPGAEGDAEAASFDGLLRLIAEKHNGEVEAYKSELGALQEKIAKLTRMWKEPGDDAAECCCSPGGGRPHCAAAAPVAPLPGVVSPPHEDDDNDAGRDLPTLRLSRVETSVEVASFVETPAARGISSGTASSQLGPRAAGDAEPGEHARPGSLSSLEQVAFPLRQSWRQTDEPPHSASTLSNFRKLATLNIHPTQSGDEDDHVSPWYVSEPNSHSRLAWDIVGATFIFYDLFTLPMAGFEPPRTAFSICMDWVTLIFWTLNIVASVTAGYSEEGLLVMEPGRILVKYLKTWFVLDLVVVVPDWIFTLAETTSGAADDGDGGSEGETVKLLRVLRLVRMVRLVRLVKLKRMFATFNDLINSEYTSVIMNIVQMILALLVINHLICCVWYSLSKACMQSKQMTWIEASGFEGDGWLYLYWTSFHWSITHFAPAGMNVQPQNLAERVFAVCVVIFALIGFSYIVGSITQSLAQLRSMNAEESKLFWDLRRYLARNKVPQQLSIRIQKYLEHMWQATQDSKPSKDVRLIQLLSEQLNSELKYELAIHHLKVHPFLSELCTISSVTVQRIANSAVSRKLLAEGDTLFHPGEAATHMYIVVAGSYLYKRVDILGVPHCEEVQKGEDWIAEPALWTENWNHCGLLTAVDHSDNVTVDSVTFMEQVRLNPQAHVFTSHYARNFLHWLNGLPPEQLSDISQGENVSDLCRSFMPDVFRDGEPDGKGRRGSLRGVLSGSLLGSKR